MNYATAISGPRHHTKNKRRDKDSCSTMGNTSSLLIAAMFILGSVGAIAFRLPIKNIMQHYSYDVLAILVTMELFTNLIAETGIMQLLALWIAQWSKGKKRLCLVMFGGMMFLISSVTWLTHV